MQNVMGGVEGMAVILRLEDEVLETRLEVLLAEARL